MNDPAASGRGIYLARVFIKTVQGMEYQTTGGWNPLVGIKNLLVQIIFFIPKFMKIS